MPSKAPKRGRPVEHTPKLAAEICAKLAEGMTLRAVSRLDGMPPESTVRLWALDDRDGFAAQYAKAREIGYQSMADETLEIADDGSNDTYKTDEGLDATNHDVIARSRLRVDTRKWLLSKALPKIYGDKLSQEVSGPDGQAVSVVHRIERIIVSPEGGE